MIKLKVKHEDGFNLTVLQFLLQGDVLLAVCVDANGLIDTYDATTLKVIDLE
ncbi:MAG: hypothetical protein MUE81_19275 [Thermoflexibacter sp.]|jgi:hypothetical protein|nr:hypothetical protein [Thermoflexibacter sp.]